MKDKTLELWKANADILTLIRLVNEIGWEAIREQSIQRILYLSKVLFSFVYVDEPQMFGEYNFSITISGPYSDLVYRSLVDLKKSEIIFETDGKIELTDQGNKPKLDFKREEWLKTIVYILGLYGESKVFNFTVRDPVYDQAVKSNAPKILDLSPENNTIKVLNSFKKAFEETLEDTHLINKKEYLELYFEYVFSKIIKNKQ